MTSSKSSRSCDPCDKCDTLYCAVLEKHDMCLDALLRRREPSDYPYCNHQRHTTIEYDTPLIMASERGYLDCAKMLLAAGADVNEYARKKGTALEWAAIKGQYNCIELLVEAGADVNISNKYKATALDLALGHGHLKCVELLIESGADVSDISIVHAAQQGSNRCIEVLIENGADVNSKDGFGTTALMYAAEAGNDHCVAVFIGAGADVNVQDHKGKTASMNTARGEFPYRARANDYRGDYYKCTKHLIQAGADVNIADNQALTASRICNELVEQVERVLLAGGVDVNMKTEGGNSILTRFVKEHLHRREVMLNILTLLICAGGNINDVAQDTRQDIRDICIMNICKERIRTHLLQKHPSNLFVSVPKWGLPMLLEKFLLNNISLEDNNENHTHRGRYESQ